jgi:hypothetical protein
MIPQFTGVSVLPAVMIPVKPAVMIPVKPAVMIPVKSPTRIPESTFSPLVGACVQAGMVASPRRTPAFANVALDAIATVKVMAATMFLKFVIVLILLNILF